MTLASLISPTLPVVRFTALRPLSGSSTACLKLSETGISWLWCFQHPWVPRCNIDVPTIASHTRFSVPLCPDSFYHTISVLSDSAEPWLNPVSFVPTKSSQCWWHCQVLRPAQDSLDHNYFSLCALTVGRLFPRQSLLRSPSTIVSVQTPMSNKFVFWQVDLLSCRVSHPWDIFSVVPAWNMLSLMSVTFIDCHSYLVSLQGQLFHSSFLTKRHSFQSFLQHLLLFLTVDLQCSPPSDFTEHISAFPPYSTSVRFLGHGYHEARFFTRVSQEWPLQFLMLSLFPSETSRIQAPILCFYQHSSL